MKKNLRKHKNNYKYLIGIDEVGRGPIAGPVAVGAFIFLIPEAEKLLRGVKESKQLTEEKREIWFRKINEIRESKYINKKNNLVDYAVTFQSEKIIDTKGLSFAIKNALRLSLEKLLAKNPQINFEETLVLLDGGLKAPIEWINQETIIKGDVKERVIALASICAKVTRDRVMCKWAKKYPAYGFDKNKGYGTKMHYKAIEKSGLIDLHRRSFLRKIV